MFNSDIAVYFKQVNYYEDMSKFAKLGLWIIQCLGGDVDDIESLIGEYPTLQNKRELTQDDLELIDNNRVINLLDSLQIQELR